MIRIVLLGLAIAVAGASGVSAEPRMVMGAGMTSCGEWLRTRSRAENRVNLQEISASFQMQTWIDGYLSGRNAANTGGPEIFASKPSSIAMYAWVDNYCDLCLL